MEEKINMEDLANMRREMIKDMFVVFNSYPKENGIPVNIYEYLELANSLNNMICKYLEI